MKKLRDFLICEGGQGAIEYIMLTGGIIVAVVAIFVIYKQAASSFGNKVKLTVNQTGEKINESVQGRLDNL